jgi:hypothetical protein
MSTFTDYADLYCEPWRDPDPKAEAANRRFSRLVKERGLTAKWNAATTQEQKNSILRELEELSAECGLDEPLPAQSQPSLIDKIRIK